ncbi:capsular exopolysaccharide family [Pseudoramibacter alactolyticus ATCC 23263]|uniref:Capsular exopolysaccharide family n=1 Tax=Pseudoramibacter alactolyticus ATCC 23263 TaxID=887929 RepID=E6MFB2_9FIRM|nr:CpsD/CapB family tyrosine-protein kinase [Pseudoramibacter alactolyticus]EFV02272.1 capsular exopolysaccharide family [Pseudoramibacter alactolyticus ATCC 23263]
MGLFKFGNNKHTPLSELGMDHVQPAVYAEAYRSLAANVMHRAETQNVKSILITSAIAREGKTATAINLALVMSRAGKKVLLIDGNTHSPKVGACLAVPDDQPGLSNWLAAGGYDWDQYIAEKGALWIMPLGTEAQMRIETVKMQAMLSALSKEYDYILVDGPSIGAYADASTLAEAVDAVLWVVKQYGANREEVIAAKQRLDILGAEVIGTTLTQFDIMENKNIREQYHRAFG